MTTARKREAPATALPGLLLQFDILTEALSGTEGTMAPDERRRTTEKRNRIADQIAELESGIRRKRNTAQAPCERESARRARGDVRVSYRTSTEVRSKLTELAEQDGCPANEILDMLVEGEWRHRAEHKTKKPVSSG